VKAGKPMTIEWDPKKVDALVLRIHVVVTDKISAFQSTDLFPYNISIPHEDVEFEFGKADIRPEEEPKMVKALAEIDKAIARYGTAVKLQGVEIRLFVGGHTDTKGSPAANQGLSERRALAIARWFAGKGVKVGVYARGFGESDLKVDTPDETEEQKNRRVEYDVGVNGPTGSASGWTKVK
jgi:outer membrane protein OmpA-like peptidoglycan-associated protein